MARKLEGAQGISRWHELCSCIILYNHVCNMYVISCNVMNNILDAPFAPHPGQYMPNTMPNMALVWCYPLQFPAFSSTLVFQPAHTVFPSSQRRGRRSPWSSLTRRAGGPAAPAAHWGARPSSNGLKPRINYIAGTLVVMKLGLPLLMLWDWDVL